MKPETATPSERERFEAWARRQFGEMGTRMNPDGRYEAIDARLCWLAWQTATVEAPAQPPREVPPEPSKSLATALAICAFNADKHESVPPYEAEDVSWSDIAMVSAGWVYALALGRLRS